MWVEQVSRFELGNFVMLTPAIRGYAEAYNTAVGVFFNTTWIGELFRDSPYIEVLSRRPSAPPALTTKSCISKCKDESKYATSYRLLRNLYPLMSTDMPAPFVGKVAGEYKPLTGRKYIAVVNGCLSVKTRALKLLSAETLTMIISKVKLAGLTPVLLGGPKDIHNWNNVNTDGCIALFNNSITEAASIINGSVAFIANDTGLYHVSGALGKPSLVLWLKTPFIENKSPAASVTYVLNPSRDLQIFDNAVDKFLTGLDYASSV